MTRLIALEIGPFPMPFAVAPPGVLLLPLARSKMVPSGPLPPPVSAADTRVGNLVGTFVGLIAAANTCGSECWCCAAVRQQARERNCGSVEAVQAQVPRFQRDHPRHRLRKLRRSLHHPNRPSLRSGRSPPGPPRTACGLSRGIPPNRRSRPSRRSGCYHHHRHHYRRSPGGGLGRYRRSRRRRRTAPNRRFRPDHRRTREQTV